MKINEDFLLKPKYTDYVESQGNTNNWKWRKWHSGFCEIVAYKQHENITVTTSSAGTYYNDSTGRKTLQLPFHLTHEYGLTVFETPSHSSSLYVYNCYVAADGNNLVTDFRSHGSSTNAVCAVWYYITGAWK